MPAPSPRFATTRWSVVLTAGGAQTPAAREALETLCRSYWFPLYAFARRKGRTAEAAEDSVQEFFGRLLAKEGLGAGLGAADPERGRFRSFLLSSFQNHLINEAAEASAQKRGGGRKILSLSGSPEDAEARLEHAISHEETPERLFDRDWALSLLEKALKSVRQAYEDRGRGELFEVLKDVLLPATDLSNHAERGEALGMRPGAVKVAVHRLRARYREALLAAVADTVPDEPDLDERVQGELERLLAALS
ncbi:MAG: sigma-70 family RNA polymerase sigma factor [Planctomycetes bacterium]|nr:sigma-70 family RNA polymerase sigma factor [Planctomycetota bacterium]